VSSEMHLEAMIEPDGSSTGRRSMGGTPGPDETLIIS